MKHFRKRTDNSKFNTRSDVHHRVKAKHRTPVIRPIVEPKKYSLEGLVSKISKHNRHEATDWTPVGKEEL
jgi:hypothetical protein